MTKASETQSQTEQLKPTAPSKETGRKSILALSVFALGLNATAAVYTISPSDFALPNVSGLVAELLPHEGAPAPIPGPVVAALRDIQSAQQQHAAAQLEYSSALQHSTVLLEHDSTVLVGLRQSLTDEQSDIKKISTQLSTLMAKVDSLQNAIAPEITSSIPKGRPRARLSNAARKRIARSLKPMGPISVGGAPLTTAPAQSPEG
jgi:uncharacterized coiled-coil protein SlyX